MDFRTPGFGWAVVLLLMGMHLYAGTIRSTPYLIAQGSYRFPLTDWKQRTLNVNRPWFDASGKLQWDGDAADSNRCQASLQALTPFYTDVKCRVKTHFSHPRLDECRCEYRRDDNQTGVWQSFIGGENNETWERHRCDKNKKSCAYLSDITTSGIIFADHEVWSIENGQTLFPAQNALRQQHFSSLYLPSSGRFVEFDGESGLMTSRGGLWMFDPRSNQRELIDPLDGGLTGFWKVEKMSELSASGVLVLVERRATRGLGHLRLKLFDALERRTLGIYKLSARGLYSDIHIQQTPDGQIAVSFFDAEAYVVVHYRIKHR